MRHYSPRRLAALALLLLLAGCMHPRRAADDGPAVAVPGPRTSHALVYDEQRRAVVLLDGYSPFPGASHPELTDVWGWDGGRWRLLPGAGPTARFLSAAAYDSRRGRIISYGGRVGRRAEVRGDSWEWDGRVWRRMTDTSVGARDHHMLAYDAARGRTVLFGGGPFPRRPGPWATDTWVWDGTAWRQAAVDGPAGRALSAMVYDGRRRQVVLFGGVGAPPGDGGAQPIYGDSWGWDGAAWRQLADGGPPGRAGHAMACDQRAGVVLLYGGESGAELLGDMWRWDGERWSEIPLTGPTPGRRRAHAMAYDAARGRTVLYGGVTRAEGAAGSTALGDTWEWDGARWREVGVAR